MGREEETMFKKITSLLLIVCLLIGMTFSVAALYGTRPRHLIID
jgi:hypothetical protein